MRAQKLLKQYERLYTKVTRGKRLSPKRIRELDAKRTAGTITSKDLSGRLMEIFPGELKGLTPKEIKEICK